MSFNTARAATGWRSESGQALAVTALGMLVLLGAAGIAVDLGYLRYEQRRMQTAADSAALAATAELLNGSYVTAGQTDAAANGFTNGSGNVTVAVNYPPTEGIYVNQSYFVEVIVTDMLPTFFMKALGTNSETITARAVGHYWNGTNCIYALDPSAGDAIKVTGTVALTAACGIMDDSSSSSAFDKTGSGSVTVPSNMITGGLSESGSGTLSPTPTTGVPPESDPLAYLPEPTVGSCTYTSKFSVTGSGTTTVSPGVYCGGLSITGSGSVTFSAGTYIIEGSGLNVTGSTTVTGSDVMFYITGGASVNFVGSDSSSLTANTNGTYAGILFFQDRTDSSAANISGSATTDITGALYFPDAQLNYNGSSSTSAYTIVVADTIVINGSTTINDNYATLPNGSPIKTAILAE
jgi:hypothetical protein